MIVELRYPDKIRRNFSIKFLQGMLNRVAVGLFRYGDSTRETGPPKRWVRRMELELKKYRDTANTEHLINLANYAMLEYEEPGSKLDVMAKSATRGRL